jgi:restriction system protein
MFVVMGSYTADAMQFAAQVGMTLVDGEELLQVIGSGLRGEAIELHAPTAVSGPPCPACGAEMVRRTVGRGAHVGQDFWGCSTFPACRGTAPIPDEVPIAL